MVLVDGDGGSFCAGDGARRGACEGAGLRLRLRLGEEVGVELVVGMGI